MVFQFTSASPFTACVWMNWWGRVIYTLAEFLFYILVCITLSRADKKSASHTLSAEVRKRGQGLHFFLFSLSSKDRRTLLQNFVAVLFFNYNSFVCNFSLTLSWEIFQEKAKVICHGFLKAFHLLLTRLQVRQTRGAPSTISNLGPTSPLSKPGGSDVSMFKPRPARSRPSPASCALG